MGIFMLSESIAMCAVRDQDNNEVVHNEETRKQSGGFLSKVKKAAVVVGFIAVAMYGQHYINTHPNNLDSDRAFTCAQMYHQFADNSVINRHVCAHRQPPYQQTEMSLVVPGISRGLCWYPSGPHAPTWALPGEIEALSVPAKPNNPIEHTTFRLICRHDPR